MTRRTALVILCATAAFVARGVVPNSFAQSPLPPSVSDAQATRIPIRLSEAQEKLIGITFGTVAEQNANELIDAVGTVALDERRESYVQLRAPGWIQAVVANETWASVHQGDPLFAIYSPDIETDEQSYISSLREYVALAPNAALRVKRGAASIVNAAIDRLRYVGVSDRELQRLSHGGAASGQIEIDAPIDGVIIERNAYPNMYVQPSTRLYTIADLSDVWVYATVFQDRLGEVKPGDKVEMSVDTYPGETFHGVVQFIWPEIDPATRAGRVRCVFDNAAGRLKLGMFSRVSIEAPLGRALIVPESGVLRTGDGDVAFVSDEDGDLRPVAVQLGPRVKGGFVVRRGLRAGNHIVTSANFLIDAESQTQASMIGGSVDAAPLRQAATPATAVLTVETAPAPIRRGENRIHVGVRDASGRPVRGAEVSIVMYMPPMPSMGMAAMRVAANATADGSGYSAEVTIPAGGSWRMTVVVRKDGREVGRTEKSVSAAGPV